jgi:hypothetical protein
MVDIANAIPGDERVRLAMASAWPLCEPSVRTLEQAVVKDYCENPRVVNDGDVSQDWRVKLGMVRGVQLVVRLMQENRKAIEEAGHV